MFLSCVSVQSLLPSSVFLQIFLNRNLQRQLSYTLIIFLYLVLLEPLVNDHDNFDLNRKMTLNPTHYKLIQRTIDFVSTHIDTPSICEY